MKRALLILTLLAAGAVFARRRKALTTEQINDMLMEHDPRYDLTVRGYRNNNPLNLRISAEEWKGKIPLSQNTDRNVKTGKMEFEQFLTMPYGFRANMINMRTQINRGNNTIEKLVHVWAPADDGNNPAGYTQRVCKTTGYDKTDIINPANAKQMQNIAYAMAIVENGSAPQWDDIQKGWDMI